MKTLKGIIILFVGIVVLFSCQNEEFINETEQSQFITSTKRIENSEEIDTPRFWLYMHSWLSRGSCWTGPGVCFQSWNGGNDIEMSNNIREVFHQSSINNENPDFGIVAFKKEGDRLRLAFSESLEEDQLIVIEDVILNKEIVNALSLESNIIPRGRYSVSFENFEHGEAIVPLRSR